MDTPDFYTTVYAILQEVPEGRVITYGWLARLAGQPTQARRTGRALCCLPDHFKHLPAHRVVNSQGRCAPGWTEQRGLLEKEGVGFRPNGCVDLSRYLWEVVRSLT